MWHSLYKKNRRENRIRKTTEIKKIANHLYEDCPTLVCYFLVTRKDVNLLFFISEIHKLKHLRQVLRNNFQPYPFFQSSYLQKLFAF